MVDPFTDTITSINQMKPLTDIILKEMDEPDLANKNIEVYVLSSEELDKFLINKRGATPETASIIAGHTILPEDPINGVYEVRLRQHTFGEIFELYFHELGHIAHMGKSLTFSFEREQKIIISETLAFAFQYHAKEKFNELLKGNIEFNDVKPENREESLRYLIDNNPMDMFHRKALELIYETIKLGVTYEDIYKNLKKVLFK